MQRSKHNVTSPNQKCKTLHFTYIRSSVFIENHCQIKCERIIFFLSFWCSPSNCDCLHLVVGQNVLKHVRLHLFIFFFARKREAQRDFSIFLGRLSVRQKAWEVIFIEVLLVGLL